MKTEEALEEILIARLQKAELVSYIKKHQNQFKKVIEWAVTDKQPQAWRAAWLLNQSMKENDERIKPYIKTIIKEIKTKGDGHQRELLKVLEKMKIGEKYEGKLFNVCMWIWESIKKSPSVRGTAFKMMLDLSKKYPELKNEIESLTQSYYTDSLSHGIKHSLLRMIEK